MSPKFNVSDIITGILVSVGVITGLVLLAGFPVMWLWNSCMPEIFGLPVVDYWTIVPFIMLWAILLRPITYTKVAKE